MADAGTTAVELVIGEAVATLTIAAPERRNPIGTATAGRIARCLREAEAAPEIRVVVITGAGESFSSGGDLKEFLDTAAADATVHWEAGALWGDLYRTLQTLSKPTIARVRGPAFAGGCGIVAACDFAVASEEATFATPEAKVGLFPLFIMPAMIRAVGRRNALSLALTGRVIGAAEALAMGLIGSCVPAVDLDAEIARLCRQLVAIGPLTMSMGKRAFHQMAELDFDHALEAARDLRVSFMGSPELRAGISRFLDKAPRRD